MRYSISSAQGPYVVSHAASDKVVCLYLTKELALSQIRDADTWGVEDVEDELEWLVAVANLGVTHVIEVTGPHKATDPREINARITELRFCKTIECDPPVDPAQHPQ